MSLEADKMDDWCTEEDEFLAKSAWGHGKIIKAKNERVVEQFKAIVEEIDKRYDGKNNIGISDLLPYQNVAPINPEASSALHPVELRSTETRLKAIYRTTRGFARAYGGRKRARVDNTRKSFENRCWSVVSKFLLSEYGSGETVAIEITNTALSLAEGNENFKAHLETYNGKSQNEKNLCCEKICQTIHDEATRSCEGLEIIKGPVLAICTRFQRVTEPSEGQGQQSKVRERHSVCTWIDSEGYVRCTCIGMTDFDIKAQGLHFQAPCCDHAKSMMSFMKFLASVIFGLDCELPLHFIGTLLNTLTSLKCPLDYFQYLNNLPSVMYMQKRTVYVLIRVENSAGREIQFIPLRFVPRIRGLICCFCDLDRTSSCTHVMEANMADMHGGEFHPEQNTTNLPHGLAWDPMADICSVLNLPLSIVNCPNAIKRDSLVAEVCKAGSTFHISAPTNCVVCSSPRNESTKFNNHGILMCSHGPCKMVVEEYTCSNNACKSPIHSEGRDEWILLQSLSSGATHVLLRHLLVGVALGIGTLTSRVGEYHSRFTANVMSDLIPGISIYEEGNVQSSTNILRTNSNHRQSHEWLQPTMTHIQPAIQTPILRTSHTDPDISVPSPQYATRQEIRADADAGCIGQQRKWRSERLLKTMCRTMCKLMAISPPKRLFSCPTCENESERVHAVCADGIWAGYKRNSQRKFTNFSQLISAPRPSTSRPKPLQGLLRQSQTTSLLLSAITGKSIRITSKSFNAAISTIRLCGMDFFPEGFRAQSICGKSREDFSEDGGNGVLKRTQDVLQYLFDVPLVCRRVGIPLAKYLRTLLPSNIDTSIVQENTQSTNAHCYHAVCSFLQNSDITEDDGSIAWNPLYSEFIVREHSFVFRNFITFFKAILQGPLSQMVQISQIQELRNIVDTFDEGPESLFLLLASNEQSNNSLLRQRRLLRAGLFAVGKLENIRAGLQCKLGPMLQDVVRRLDEYYLYFQELPPSLSIMKYWQEWGSNDRSELLEKVSNRANPGLVGLGDSVNCYVLACRTGFFFPAHPQIRPLPFDQGQTGNFNADGLGMCSKNYLQKTKSFTPGALTFCCSCNHPIIMGFKVLEKHEGPKSVLDVLITRFALPPGHVIYDFVCALFAVAAFTLWWALQSTTYVCDSFHAYNHCCSPNFIPSYHDSLNMSNTVSHEQRNRAIKELVKTLRSSTLEFYIALLSYHVCLLNVKATAKRQNKFKERPLGMSAHDLEWLYFHVLELNCNCCAREE